MLAVKVENLPQARPQTGLDSADIVYEEPVEAGITRFIVLYQCRDTPRIEPIRSGRFVDPDILVQFGRPLFAYAGAIEPVLAAVARTPLIDINYIRAAPAYHRDPGRFAPHNLYSSTAELYAAAHVHEGPPAPLFTYATSSLEGPPARLVHIPFSPYSDVYWKWDRKRGVYLRFYGSNPAVLSDRAQISATNVVVQTVSVQFSPYVEDENGVHELYIHVVGRGRAYIYQGGRVIAGWWVRPSLSKVTRFVDDQGGVITLDAGVTWVELVPQGIRISPR